MADGTEVGFVEHVGEDGITVGGADGPGVVAVGGKDGNGEWRGCAKVGWFEGSFEGGQV